MSNKTSLPVDSASIDAAEYSRLLQGCRLRPLHLVECRSEDHHDRQEPWPRCLKATERSSFRPAEEDVPAVVAVECGLESRVGRRIELRIRATYECDILSDEPLPDWFLEAYAELNFPFNVWPFWRQFAVSAAAMMGLQVWIPLRMMRQPPPDAEVVPGL